MRTKHSICSAFIHPSIPAFIKLYSISIHLHFFRLIKILRGSAGMRTFQMREACRSMVFSVFYRNFLHQKPWVRTSFLARAHRLAPYVWFHGVRLAGPAHTPNSAIPDESLASHTMCSGFVWGDGDPDAININGAIQMQKCYFYFLFHRWTSSLFFSSCCRTNCVTFRLAVDGIKMRDGCWDLRLKWFDFSINRTVVRMFLPFPQIFP